MVACGPPGFCSLPRGRGEAPRKKSAQAWFPARCLAQSQSDVFVGEAKRNQTSSHVRSGSYIKLQLLAAVLPNPSSTQECDMSPKTKAPQMTEQVPDPLEPPTFGPGLGTTALWRGGESSQIPKGTKLLDVNSGKIQGHLPQVSSKAHVLFCHLSV